MQFIEPDSNNFKFREGYFSSGSNFSLHRTWCKLYNIVFWLTDWSVDPTKVPVSYASLIVQRRVFHLIQVSPFTEYGVSSTTILIRITAWSVDLAEASVTKAPFIVKRRQLHLFPVFPFYQILCKLYNNLNLDNCMESVPYLYLCSKHQIMVGRKGLDVVTTTAKTIGKTPALLCF